MSCVSLQSSSNNLASKYPKEVIYKKLTYQDLAQNFEFPILQAASNLGVSETYLKRLCRSTFNIPRWPYRRLRSLQEKREKLLSVANSSEALVAIESVGSEITHIMKCGISLGEKRKPNSSGVLKKRGRPPKNSNENFQIHAPKSAESSKIFEKYYEHSTPRQDFNPLGLMLQLDVKEVSNILTHVSSWNL
jgi:AraC-like DNA-binding protein